MNTRVTKLLVSVVFITASFAHAQPDNYRPDARTVLRLIRNDKLDLVLPGAMRDNNVDMWIHAARHGDPDALEYEFGRIDGYLIFTDLGDRIERAIFGGVFGGSGGVENIDVQGSMEVARAVAGYDYGKVDSSVYNEITEFVAERDPKTIAVNFSNWLAVADGISHAQYRQLEEILGPKYSKRIVSAENLITDFRSRRILREIVVQANTLEIARQNALKAIRSVKPGVTALGDLPGGQIYYSAVSDMTGTESPHYTLQRGDFFYVNGRADWMDFGFSSFGVDTKYHAYILREGESSAPESIQHAFDRAIKGQWIMRPAVRVGMTAGECLKAMISAMEEAGYIYTPFTDDHSVDYPMIQKALANTDKSGFSVDLHVQGNNGGSLVTVGPSMAPFRRDRDHLVIQENHILAFEYMVHTNLPERPGYPVSINISNVQAVTSRGVEWIQPPNERIHLIH